MSALPEIVSAYLEHYRTKDKALFWAWEAVENATHDLARGLPLCLALIEAAENDEELAYVAAGPLEDLLNRVGLAAAESLEVPARRSAKVREALPSVWLNSASPAYDRWQAMLQKYSR